jgi:hypothetical protein
VSDPPENRCLFLLALRPAHMSATLAKVVAIELPQPWEMLYGNVEKNALNARGQLRVCVSAASRSASPQKLKARTLRTIISPGASNHGY